MVSVIYHMRELCTYLYDYGNYSRGHDLDNNHVLLNTFIYEQLTGFENQRDCNRALRTRSNSYRTIPMERNAFQNFHQLLPKLYFGFTPPPPLPNRIRISFAHVNNHLNPINLGENLPPRSPQLVTIAFYNLCRYPLWTRDSLIETNASYWTPMPE